MYLSLSIYIYMYPTMYEFIRQCCGMMLVHHLQVPQCSSQGLPIFHPAHTCAGWRGLQDDGDFGFSLKIYTPVCCHINHMINGSHKQYMQVDIVFNYSVHVSCGLPGKCLYLSPQTHTFLVPAKPAPERCIFLICLKTCSWKSNMEHVVKYDVYLDVLLVGSVYVTKSVFFKEHPESRHPANPIIQA